MRRCIEQNGTCSIPGVDEGRPVTKISRARFQPGNRASRGLHSGTFRADLKEDFQIALPQRTALLVCWHVARARASFIPWVSRIPSTRVGREVGPGNRDNVQHVIGSHEAEGHDGPHQEAALQQRGETAGGRSFLGGHE